MLGSHLQTAREEWVRHRYNRRIRNSAKLHLIFDHLFGTEPWTPTHGVEAVFGEQHELGRVNHGNIIDVSVSTSNTPPICQSANLPIKFCQWTRRTMYANMLIIVSDVGFIDG